MPISQQMKVFDTTSQPDTHRRCIIATNIAETGITVPGVRYVVDSGFTRYNYFDVKSGMETWVTCLLAVLWPHRGLVEPQNGPRESL